MPKTATATPSTPKTPQPIQPTIQPIPDRFFGAAGLPLGIGTGMALGVNEQGQPGILLMLEGGAELTLALSPSDLPAMRDMIDQAIEASELKQKH